MATVPTWVEIYRSPRPRDCDERLLLLEAVGIVAVVRPDEAEWGVFVAPDQAGRAYFELTRWAAENRPLPPARQLRLHGGALAAAAAWAALLFVCAALATHDAFGRDWLAAGVLDGTRVRAGEWWRAVTALTLHADLAHWIANAGFGTLFGTLAGRVYGPGRAWLLILLAAGGANLVEALWMPAGLRSLGASTAVFAALGLLCVWRWPATRRGVRAGIRSASVVAALVLLALLGTGDAHTDVLAHALGFVAGALLGLPAARAGRSRRHGQRGQWLAGAAVLAAVVAAWTAALVSAGS